MGGGRGGRGEKYRDKTMISFKRMEAHFVSKIINIQYEQNML